MIGAPTWFVELGDFITVAAPSPSGDRILVASLSGEAHLLGHDGSLIAKLPEHPLGVLCGAWSPDGSLLAVGGQDHRLRICTADGDVVTTAEGAGWIAAMAWSPDGRHLAAAAGRQLLVLDAAGSLVHRYPSMSSTITAVRWADNARRVGVTSYGGISWFDIDRLSDDTPSRRHEFKGAPLSLVLAPNGKWACAGFQDATIHLWRLWSGDDLSMSGYPAKIEHLAFRDDSHWMASACLDELTVWDFSGKGPRGTRPASGTAHERHISWMGWRPGGSQLVTGGADGRLVLWPSPRSTKHPLEPDAIAHHDTAVATAGWFTDGRRLVVGRSDGVVELRVVS